MSLGQEAGAGTGRRGRKARSCRLQGSPCPTFRIPPDRTRSLVALIAPDAETAPGAGSWRSPDRGLPVAQEFETWPSPGDLPEIARLNCRVALVDLDDDIGQAHAGDREYLRPRRRDDRDGVLQPETMPTLLRRSMQAGAREFLIEPIASGSVARGVRPAPPPGGPIRKAAGKILVFVPTKGGVGVTTVAANFALALTKESGARVVVVDMDFQLGEIALGLGMTATFSVVDALLNPARLDRGFSVDSAAAAQLRARGAGALPRNTTSSATCRHEGADRLFRILREEFDYVVVDAGTCHGDMQETLFEMADTIYLVTEMTFPALRNAHRMIAFLSARDGSRRTGGGAQPVQFAPRRASTKTAPPRRWPGRSTGGFRTVTRRRGPRRTAASRWRWRIRPITQALVQMARSACGKPLEYREESGRRV